MSMTIQLFRFSFSIINFKIKIYDKIENLKCDLKKKQLPITLAAFYLFTILLMLPTKVSNTNAKK